MARRDRREGGLSGLGVLLKGKLLEEAVALARRARHLEAAETFERSGGDPSGQSAADGAALAYAFYRRALCRQRDGDDAGAERDLETAIRFPGAGPRVGPLARARLTALRRDPHPEVARFDAAVADRFDRPPSVVDLREEFLRRYGLTQARRRRSVEGVGEMSSVGVYRWAGDSARNEQWSRLIRRFKAGDPTLPAFFGRILAEHVLGTPECRAWLGEIDYVVPVPAADTRTAERGADIVALTAEHLCRRLRLPLRTNLLRRRQGSARSRFVGRAELAAQYRFRERKSEDVRGRTVLLVDDVVNRGHTTGVCASLLREAGCERVELLVLARAESTLQSQRREQAEGGSDGSPDELGV